jgi:hypothetical protein
LLSSLKVWWIFSPTINKIKDWSYHSKTVLWGYAKVGAGGLSLLVSLFAEILNNSDVKSAIGAFNLPPKYALALSVLGVVTLYVRMSNSNQPVSSTPTIGSGS